MKRVPLNHCKTAGAMLTLLAAACVSNAAHAQKWASNPDLVATTLYAETNAGPVRSLKTILVEVREKFNADFLYRSGALPKHQVRFNVNEYQDLKQLLQELLAPYSLEAKPLFGNTWAILNAEHTASDYQPAGLEPRAFRQSARLFPAMMTPVELMQQTITGVVSDGAGNPLPGVSVLVKGTQNGTSTETDGSFSLDNVPAESTLVFSFIGYITLEEPLEGRERLDIQLEPDFEALDEVVVVGYGTQKKTSLTSAVSTVSAEELTERSARNLSANLQGLAPGLTVWDRGGEPGNANVNVRIRGITTLNPNNNPLVIVDGIEQGLNDINPNDIETISVLKDAASTAIYGSRAANGVILVTTKRGKAGSFRVSYDAWLDIQNLTTIPEHMDVESYLRLQNLAFENRGSEPLYPEDVIQQYVSGEDRLHFPLPNTWFETVVRKNAPMQNHSLSVSGGSERISTLFRLNFFDQEGIYPNRNHTRYEIRMNNDFKVSDAIDLSADLNIRRKDRFTTNGQGNLYHRMIHSSQLTVPQYPDGTYGLSKQQHNPLAYTDPAIAGGNDATTDVNIINLKGTWRILEGLSFTSQYAFDFQKFSRLQNFPRFEIRDYWNGNVLRNNNINQLQEFRSESLQKTWNNTLNYVLERGDHQLNLLAGYSEIDFDFKNLSANGRDFYNNSLLDLGQSDPENREINSVYADWGLRSVFGRANYSFREKYIFEFNARYDGSSRFARGNRYTFFPSVAGAWRISEEAFWEPLKSTIGELKIRASWGETGNQSVGTTDNEDVRDFYSYFDRLVVGNYYSFNDVPVTGVLQEQYASSGLGWEITRQTDIGLDLSMLKGKINFSFDWFDKLTEGILLELPIPGIVGLQPSYTNAGAVQNRGWELQLTHRNSIRDLRYGITMNLSNVRNEITNLAGTGPYYSEEKDWFIRQEGQPIDALWGYRTDGFYTQEDMDNNYPLLSPDARVGDIKYIDINNDGVINSQDREILGSSIPRLTYGTSLNLGWRNFDLNLQVQGVGKRNMALMGAFIENGSWEGFTLARGKDYWTPENTDAAFPRPQKQSNKNTNPSDWWVLNGAYVRLKNVQLGYTLPVSLTEKVGIGRLRVYTGGTNLFTITDLKDWGFDAETPTGRSDFYPTVKTWTFGLNVEI